MTGSAAPPGWHDDPSGARVLRWWDGSQWTEHISARGFESLPAQRLDEERTAARWARLGLIGGALAGVVFGISVALLFRWIRDDWDRLDGLADTARFQGISFILQSFVLLVLASQALVYLWAYRLAMYARAIGLPARREPGLVLVSFLIPILNLWWPYQSICDTLPAGHEGRRLILRWWVLYLIAPQVGTGLLVTAFVPVPVTLLLAGAAMALAVVEVVLGRRVIAMILDVHERLLLDRRLESVVAGS